MKSLPYASCPQGYFTSGGFCVPHARAQDGIPKSGERQHPVYLQLTWFCGLAGAFPTLVRPAFGSSPAPHRASSE
jgi:hypothetical protein